MLTGLTALAELGDVSRLARWLVAVLAGIPYLAAAFYAESAFKEPILSLLLVGLVLVLEPVRRQRFARPGASLVPAGVLVAGVIYDYSYPGLALAGRDHRLLARARGGDRRRLESAACDCGGPSARARADRGACALVVLVPPDIGRMHTFWLTNGGTHGRDGGRPSTTSALANLAGPLHALRGAQRLVHRGLPLRAARRASARESSPAWR